MTCPWPASVFGLDNGSVQRGPGPVPQPAYDVRVSDGKILVRSR